MERNSSWLKTKSTLSSERFSYKKHDPASHATGWAIAWVNIQHTVYCVCVCVFVTLCQMCVCMCTQLLLPQMACRFRSECVCACLGANLVSVYHIYKNTVKGYNITKAHLKTFHYDGRKICTVDAIISLCTAMLT